jgi:hypothetical protein
MIKLYSLFGVGTTNQALWMGAIVVKERPGTGRDGGEKVQ